MAAKGPIELTVVIPSHHGDAQLLKLVESILLQEEAPTYEILVVANPPDQKLRGQLSKLQELRVCYLETKFIGANYARNLGLQSARGGIVLFVDADCLMQDRLFLRKHFGFHENNTLVTGIGGGYECLAKGIVANAYHQLQSQWLTKGLLPGYQADLVLGGNMSFKRANLGDLQFEELLQFGGTETEFIFRLARLKHRILFCPRLTISHGGELSLWGLLKKAFSQGQGAAFLKSKKYWGNALVTRRYPRSASLDSPPTRAVKLFYDVFFHGGLRWGLKNSVAPASATEKLSESLSYAHLLVRSRFRRWIFLFALRTLEAVLTLKKIGLLSSEARPSEKNKVASHWGST